jgi:beta-glucosidase
MSKFELGRRTVMTNAVLFGATMGLPLAGCSKAAPNADGSISFPKDFLWGTATSSYQIEGSTSADGRGPSIWDTLVKTPGKIKDGSNGDIACNSYTRWREDIALIKSLGLKSYRFSIAWPRIQADGTGPANQKGLDYYKNLIDGLLEAGIRPLPTMYHWDLPQGLQDKGGWPARDTADRFADYASILVKALGDRTPNWCVFNEPSAFTGAGYKDGIHAPGHKSTEEFLRATHTVNRAYGLTDRATKALRPKIQLSNAINMSPAYPATDSAEDMAATKRFDAYLNMWFAQTSQTGQYPEGVLPADQLRAMLNYLPEDEAILKAPYDWMGINYYTPFRVSADPTAKDPFLTGIKGEWATAPIPNAPKNDIGWQIYPIGLADVLKHMHKLVGDIPFEVLENGGAFNEAPDASGRIKDQRRIDFLDTHLRAVADAIAAGVPVRAYHLWSLMDNFEWSEGYSQRFGMVYTDYANGQKRMPKDSAAWYAKVAKRNGLVRAG